MEWVIVPAVGAGGKWSGGGDLAVRRPFIPVVIGEHGQPLKIDGHLRVLHQQHR
jgi:hypothetical protein